MTTPSTAVPVHHPLIIIPCGRRKLSAPAPARAMYTGVYARACRDFAIELARVLGGADIYILYGLISLDEQIQPYDARFGGENAIALEEVVTFARDTCLDRRTDVRMFGGAAYRRLVLAIWPNAMNMTPAAGIGGQLSYLRHATNYWRSSPAPASCVPFERVG